MKHFLALVLVAVGIGVLTGCEVPRSSIRSVYFGTHGSWLNGEIKDCVTTHSDPHWLGCDGNTYSTDEGRKFKVNFDGDPDDRSSGGFLDWQCSKGDNGINCKEAERAQGAHPYDLLNLETTPAEFGSQHSEYLESMKSTIAGHLPSSSSASKRVSAQIVVTVGQTGYHNHASVRTSSGDAMFDYSCVKGVEDVNRFSPLPYGYESLTVSFDCSAP
jgi:hypothetical protein